MYRQKEVLLIVVFLALIGVVFTFDSGITGLAVGSTDLAVPSDENVPMAEEGSQTFNEQSTLVGEPNLTIGVITNPTGDGIGPKAACNSWPCACGDTVTGSITMSSDLAGCTDAPGDQALQVAASNIFIDCAGFSITGIRTITGIYNPNYNNVTIKNCNIYNFTYGIRFSSSNNSNITSNTITNTSIGGLYLEIGSNATVSHNTLFNSSISIIGSLGAVKKRFNNVSIEYNFLQNSSAVGLTNVSNATFYHNIVRYADSTDGLTSTEARGLNISRNEFNASVIRICSTKSMNVTIENNLLQGVGYESGIECRNAGAAGISIINNSLQNTSGIVVYSSSDVRISNNTLSYSQIVGFNLQDSNLTSTSVSGNNISHVKISGNLAALYCTGCFINRTTFADNTFYNITGRAISLNANYSLFQNNTFRNTVGAILMGGGAFNNSFVGNSFIEVFSGTISLTQASNNWFYRNTFENNTNNTNFLSATLLLASQSNNNIFVENNFTNGTTAIYLQGDRSGQNTNNSFYDNIYQNNLWTYVIGGAYDNNFTREAVSGSLNGVLSWHPTNYNQKNIWYNSNFSNNTADINLSISDGDITFINTTDNNLTITEGLSKVTFKWYAHVNVSDENRNVLDNAVVKGYDATGSIDDQQNTTPNGIAVLTLTEYYEQGNVQYFLTHNHTIKASKPGFSDNQTSVDLILTESFALNLTLKNQSCGNIVTKDFSFSQNLSTTGNCLTVGADNIIINGNGFSIFGDGGDIGINLTNRSGVKVVNLTIFNFSKGVSLQNSHDSIFKSLIIHNNSYGFFINSSDNNSISDSSFFNNTASQLFATNDGGTNNSLINVTINITNVSVSGTASIFLKWYVDVNATYNAGLPLPNANASGYFNDTQLLEDTAYTGSDGIGRVVLSELKKNSSGIYYLTPHNITMTFSSVSGSGVNSTSINLTKTQNIKLNLSIALSCTSPAVGLNISGQTTLCPGTFTAHSMTVDTAFSNITCDSTTLVGDGDSIGINVKINNASIDYCRFSNHGTGVYFSNDYNYVNLTNLVFTACGVVSETNKGCIHIAGNGASINNVTMAGGGYGISLNSSLLSNVSKGTISGMFYGIGLNGADGTSGRNTINNFTITNTTYGLLSVSPTLPNTFYHNNVDTGISILFNNNSATIDNFNKTVNGFDQGNIWADYCDKGKDEDGDGFADNVTSLSAADYPYNSTTSLRIFTFSEGEITDYHPFIQDCPSVVFLGGGSSSGGGGSSSSAAGAAAAPAPAAPSAGSKTVQPKVEEDAYNAENAKKYLQSESTTQRISPTNFQVKFTLENTGTKRMELFPEILQQVDDPYFIITRKTLGFEGSLFSDLSCISYSNDAITGRLLKAELVNPEKIILEPGEKIDKIIEVNEGLSIPRQIKIQFTTFGETVIEQDVQSEVKAVSGTAVDIDNDNDLFDLYAVIFPQQLAERFNTGTTSPITGAAIAEPPTSNKYLLEFTVNRKTPQVLPQFKASKLALSEGLLSLLSDRISTFTDLYGPYEIREDQALVFAQQLKYEEGCFDDYEMKARIYREGETVVENSFDVSLN